MIAEPQGRDLNSASGCRDSSGGVLGPANDCRASVIDIARLWTLKQKEKEDQREGRELERWLSGSEH